MRRLLTLIFAFVILGGALVSAVHAEETITIDEFTTREFMYFDLADTFKVYEPVIYKAVYTVEGETEDTVYKVVLRFKGFGKTLVFRRKVTPGTYAETWTLLVPGGITPPATKKHKLKAKLIEAGKSAPEGLIMVTERAEVVIYIVE